MADLRPGPDFEHGLGRTVGDVLKSLNGDSKISLCISIAGTNTFEVGNTVLPYTVSPNGSVGLAGFDGSANANVRLQAFKDLLALPHNNLFEQAFSDTVSRSIAANELLTSALAGVPALQTVFPTTSLSNQLKMVARLIAARTNLGMQRQIFFCSVGGYDTHGDQLTGQANLLDRIEPGAERILCRDQRARRRTECDHVYRLGFRPDVSRRTGRAPITAGAATNSCSAARSRAAGYSAPSRRSPSTDPTTPARAAGFPPRRSTNCRPPWRPGSASAHQICPTVLPNIGRFAHPNLGIFG